MKILIIQLRRLGDILVTTPVVSYIKQALPNAQVDFLAEPAGAQILEGNPHVNEILKYDRSSPVAEIRRIRAQRYDAVLDFMNNPRSGYLTLFSNANARVGWRHPIRRIFYNLSVPIPVEPEYVPLRKIRLARHWLESMGITPPKPRQVREQFFLTAEEDHFAAAWMKNEGVTAGSFIILAPAIRKPVRSWRKEGFRAVGLELERKHGVKVYLAWGPDERSLIDEIRHDVEDRLRLLPLTTLRQMAAIFKQAALVLSNDSGAMHTAVSVDTPTVTLYGPSRPLDWNPAPSGFGPKDVIVSALEVACLGCQLRQCPVGHLCMKLLREDQVVAACEEILIKSPKGVTA